jgi:hypothetical protein
VVKPNVYKNARKVEEPVQFKSRLFYRVGGFLIHESGGLWLRSSLLPSISYTLSQRNPELLSEEESSKELKSRNLWG